MRCAARTVLSRWAMTSTVRPRAARSSAACTTRSASASSALVASSSTSTAGSFSSARAMAMRCRWPPDSAVPRSPAGEPGRCWVPPLPAARLAAHPAPPLTHDGAVALREAADEVVGVGEARGRVHLLVGGARLPEADVLHDGGAKKHGVLWARLGPERQDRHPPDMCPVPPAPPTWLMKPMTWPRSQEGSSEEMSWPSSVMLPCVGS